MRSGPCRLEPLQIPAGDGWRFGLATWPSGPVARGILHVHPFAEELNRTRRMVSTTARSLAAQGWLVLQLDHAGCGDSSGLLPEVTWQDWLDDLSMGMRWLVDQGAERTVLWALRAGSLVAAEWIRREEEAPPLLLWQPVLDGRLTLRQFLRLVAAREMHRGGEVAAQVAADAKELLEGGGTVEVAGYPVSGGLTAGLEGARLTLPAGYGSPVAVLEVSGEGGTAPTPALAGLVERWRGGSIRVETRVVEGPAFWLSHEAEAAPALIPATHEVLEGLA